MPGGIDEKVVSQRAYESITLQCLVIVKGIGFFTEFTGGSLLVFSNPCQETGLMDMLNGPLTFTGCIEGSLGFKADATGHG